MTYNVLGGTLSLTQSLNQRLTLTCILPASHLIFTETEVRNLASILDPVLKQVLKLEIEQQVENLEHALECRKLA